MKALNQGNPNGCQSKNNKHEWHEIFPFQSQNLIYTKTRESPSNPHQNPNNSKCLCKEPNNAWNKIHYGIKTIKS